MSKIDFKALGKWVPVIAAVIMAAGQALGEKREAEQLEEMEARITALESGEESE